MNFVNRRPPAAARKTLRLVDLQPGDCRYPVEGDGADTRYCGRPVVGRKSWCARCDRRVHSGRFARETRLIAAMLDPGRRR